MTNRIRHLGIALFSLALFFNAPRILASDFQSPRTAALGGAGHAGPLLNDAIYLNPSYSAFLPTYAVSGNFAWANYQDSAYKYKIDNASVQDGRSDLFQAGLAYTKRDDGTLIHLGAAKAVVASRLGVGLGAKAYFPANTGFGAPAHSFDSTFSAMFAATESIQTALIVDNIIDSATAQSYGFQREVILGSKFNVEKTMILYFDPHMFTSLPSSKYGYEGGIEFPMFEDFFLRGGLFRNATVPILSNSVRGNGFGMGLGWIAPRLSIDYGLSRLLYPMIGTMQVIGVTVYM